MTEKELVAKMIGTLAKGRKEIDNSDYKITIEALPELDEIIEHLSSPLMIMVMGEFSTGKSTFINALVGDEIAAVNATPTTAVITKLCYGEQDKILVHFTDGTEKEVKKASFKQLTAKTGKENKDKTHEKIDYVERQLPLDMLQYVTIIDSPGLNDINEKHSDTTKKFVNNADTVFWMFNALHACSKTEVDAMESLTPRLKPIAIINMMDEIDEEEDDPQEFLDNLRVQLKDKVQAVVGISAKYALEGKLEKNKTKIEIGNLKEVEQVIRELVLPNRDKFKLNTIMDELGNWIANIATDIKSEEEKNQTNKEDDYDSYLENKAKLQQNEEVLFYIAKVIKDYCTEECVSFNEQAMFFAGVLSFWGICLKNDNEKAEMYWERAALKNHVLAQRLLGVLYSEKEDLKKAIYWYKKAAEQGNADAQYRLGDCYYNGAGVEEDEQQAVYWYRKAAEQGNADAQHSLGLCYFNGEGVEEDKQQAIYWYIKAAEHGDTEVQGLLASIFKGDVKAQTSLIAICEGRGNEQDYKQLICRYTKIFEHNQKSIAYETERHNEEQSESESLLSNEVLDYQLIAHCNRKKAEQGDTYAQTSLGFCYYTGNGVRQDYQQAVYWFRKAANQGYAYAEMNLGYCYYRGNGVGEDYQQAVYWFRKAAEQELLIAQFMLGMCYLEGKGVNKDQQKSFYLRQKAKKGGLWTAYVPTYRIVVAWDLVETITEGAANRGDAEAQNCLGFYRSQGFGKPANNKDAVYWYEKAAEQGNSEAQNSLGVRYYNGEGVYKNYQQAVYWFKKSAEQGNVVALTNLAICYETGNGVRQDYQLAMHFYSLAAKQGFEVAEKKLAKQDYEWKEEKISIVVIGEFSRGKSTFVNALLGKSILPSSMQPNTAVITKISYGESPAYIIHYRDDKMKYISEEEFLGIKAPIEPIEPTLLNRILCNKKNEELWLFAHVSG